MSNGKKHYELTGSIKCNGLVEDATELLSFSLEIVTKGEFELTNVEAKNILGNLFISVLKATTNRIEP